MEDNTPLNVENIEDTINNMGDTPTYIDNQQEQIIASLLQSEQELQKSYEGFNLEQELESERFCELLANGIAMKDAYELCHADEIFNARLEGAKKTWLAELKQSLARPEEEAVATDYQGTLQPQMNKKQREELIRRAERGEIIRL